MTKPSEEPDFIVDPSGNIKDARKEKYSQHPDSDSAQEADSPFEKVPVRSTPVQSSGINPTFPILFIISIVIFGVRLWASASRIANTPKQPEGSSSFLTANWFYDEGKYEDALAQYNVAINLSPEFGEAYNNRGLVYYDLEEYDKALIDFGKAIELMPTSSTPYSNRGITYQAMGDSQSGLADLNKAIEINSRFSKAYYNRGLIYLDSSELEKAIADFDKVIELTPEFYALALKRIPTSENSPAGNIANTFDYSQTYADLPSAYLFRGTAYLNMENYDQALLDFNKAIELQPDLILAYYNRGLAYYYSGDNEKAVVELEKTVELSNDPEIQQYAQSILYEINSSQGLDVAISETDSLNTVHWNSGGVFALLVVPGEPDTLFAGTISGLYKSMDGGENWMYASKGLTNIDIRALAIDPLTPTILYAGTMDGLFKSVDSGETWINASVGLTETAIQSLAIDPVHPTTLYAGTFGEGVFKTTDGGANWNSATNGMTGTLVLTLAIEPNTQSIVYAGTMDDGLFRSLNSGETWDLIGAKGTMVLSIAIHPTTSNIIYVGTMGGLYRSLDGGESWVLLKNELPDYPYVNAVVIDPFSPATLYAAGPSVYKSIDGGDTWFLIDDKIPAPIMRVRVLALNPNLPATLYVGTEYEGVLIIRHVDEQ